MARRVRRAAIYTELVSQSTIMNDPVKPLDPDTVWMRRALELARRGIGVTAPNPAVGCVLLDRAGQLAGEGWHEYELRDHAEIMALRAASRAEKDVRGGTAYVTLEPCSITGRTPPCSNALIEAGVGRVVAATIDPNPAVAGRGLAALRAAGIEASAGVCEDEARRLNEGFARWIQHRRPFVLMKVAMTLDARIAPPPGAANDRSMALGWTEEHHVERAPYWITAEAAREAVQQLRWAADATLVGVDTVLADDPWLTDRSKQRRRRPLLRVVLDSGLRMPLDAKLVKTAQNDVVVFTVSRDEARAHELRRRGVRVEVLEAHSGEPDTLSPTTNWSQGRVPLDKVLLQLGKEDALMLLTETGTRLNTALLAAGLVDRLQLFIAPQIMGTDAVPAFRGLPQFVDLRNMEVKRHGNDLGLSSLLRDPWAETRRE